jgi:PelA/Pel-15E family pectate lyase
MRTLLALALLLPAQDDPFRDEAAKALRRAAEYFRTKVAVHGGYVWRVSEDLGHRDGERKAGPEQIWVQPPGTPTVGMAFLAAWEATRDPDYLEGSADAARALARGQLRSGGWTYSVEFDPAKRSAWAYRGEPEMPRQFNVSTLDDDTTQSALRFLARIDRALDFKDAAIHEAAVSGLAALLSAQLPHGGWSQGFVGPADPATPVLKASFPETWSRTPDVKEYWFQATLNDGLVEDAVETLLEAAKIYSKDEYRAAALKAGDFLLLARLPEPQPAWAQQYNARLQPAWARRFEPPSVTGGESQGALRVLLRLHRETGDAKYLEPVRPALDYLRRSLLPDGRLARFYELRTNEPLYFTRAYELVKHDSDLPTHYGFKVAARLDEIERELAQIQEGKPASRKAPNLDRLRAEAKEAVASLDGEGRWVTRAPLKDAGDRDPRPVLDSGVFARNLEALARYLRATKP